MYFDTPIYFLFLTIVVLIYWQMNRIWQNIFLLAASYIFYGWWDWRFLSLLLISTLVDFFCAHFIVASTDKIRRRQLLVISLTMNLGFLGFFKYFNFFEESFIEVLIAVGYDNPNRTLVSILLPPGISFYTFQAIAYIVDVYYGRLKPAKSLVDYALFISLFPHLIAGPIQRPSHLLPQVQQVRTLDADRTFHGLMLIISGLFRKCVVADNCALIAEGAFSGKLGAPNLPVLLLGAYAFAWQIYGDFSGYSDMARGSAKLLGFEFMANFRQPYLAASLQEFWQRWHISLSTWLRDYLYIPLGGSRNGDRQTYRNLMLTMLIGGLWHGANWTFVVWGAIHGAGLSLERYFRSLIGASRQEWLVGATPLRSHAGLWLKRIAIFHFVCLAWVFFRAGSISEALHLLSGLFVWSWQPEYGVALKLLALFAIPLFLIDMSNEARNEEYILEKSPVRVRFLAALILVCSVIFYSASNKDAFIYFQF